MRLQEEGGGGEARRGGSGEAGGATALHLAAEAAVGPREAKELVGLLLGAGAEPEARDSAGCTPLARAAQALQYNPLKFDCQATL